MGAGGIPVKETKSVFGLWELLASNNVHGNFHAVVWIGDPDLVDGPLIRVKSINRGFPPDGQLSKCFGIGNSASALTRQTRFGGFVSVKCVLVYASRKSESDAMDEDSGVIATTSLVADATSNGEIDLFRIVEANPLPVITWSRDLGRRFDRTVCV